jgi:hypothetical protein
MVSDNATRAAANASSVAAPINRSTAAGTASAWIAWIWIFRPGIGIPSYAGSRESVSLEGSNTDKWLYPPFFSSQNESLEWL